MGEDNQEPPLTSYNSSFGVYMFPAILIQILVTLVIVGLILWGVSQIPMDPAIAKVIRVVVIVFVCVWLVYLLAGFSGWGVSPVFRR